MLVVVCVFARESVCVCIRGGDKNYKCKLFGNVAVKVKMKMYTEDFQASVLENPVPENISGEKK